jgi:hypothetical protein
MEDLKILFVQRLAEYLVRDQGEQSIRLQMGDPHAKQWASLRAATPLFGYPEVGEAEEKLARWLGITPPARTVPAKVKPKLKRARGKL